MMRRRDLPQILESTSGPRCGDNQGTGVFATVAHGTSGMPMSSAGERASKGSGMTRLSRHPERWQDLHAAIRPEWWLPKHVNELVRELKKEGAVTADDVAGRRFGATANPVLRLAKPKT